MERKLNDRPFTTGEAAKVCRVSQQTIIRCFDLGMLKGGFRVPGSRFRRIPRDVLQKFMKENKIPEVEQKKTLCVFANLEDELQEELLAGIASIRERARNEIDVHVADSPFEAGNVIASHSPQTILADDQFPSMEHVRRFVEKKGGEGVEISLEVIQAEGREMVGAILTSLEKHCDVPREIMD